MNRCTKDKHGGRQAGRVSSLPTRTRTARKEKDERFFQTKRSFGDELESTFYLVSVRAIFYPGLDPFVGMKVFRHSSRDFEITLALLLPITVCFLVKV